MSKVDKKVKELSNAVDDVRESIIQAFVDDPKKINHLLLVGPPGCGKTTTAKKIIHSFYGDITPPGTTLFLNASDERGLDSIRAKIYPFIQCRPIIPGPANPPPRFIVLDEAETLTESAQLAMRPVFETNAHEICLIFIVNNISGIHPSLRHRFFRLQFLPPSVKTLETRINTINTSTTNVAIPKLLDAFRWRGDLRHFLLQPKDHNFLTNQIYNWLHAPYGEIQPTRKSTQEVAEDILSFGYLFKILDIHSVRELLNITDASLNRVANQAEQHMRITAILSNYRKKLETLTPF
jgi:DNA polymerase III delta prime subunit